MKTDIELSSVACRGDKAISKDSNAQESRVDLSSIFDEKIDVVASLAKHPRICNATKLAVPILLLAAAILFVTSHISSVASCNVQVFLRNDGGEVGAQVNGLFQYTLFDTAIKLWAVDAYTFSVILIVFCGIWPYVKLFATAFSWYCPSSLLSPNQRGHTLRWLDVLGKWSILEQIVITLLMVMSFLQVILPKKQPTQRKRIFRLIIAFQPSWGYFAFISAALTSLLANQIVLFNHRNAISSGWLSVKKRRMLVTGETDDLASSMPSSWFDAGTTDVRGKRRALVAKTEALSEHHFRGWKRSFKSNVNTVRAAYDHKREAESELAFRAGDAITVVHKSDPGWWFGRNDVTGETGIFPRNYVKQNTENEMKDSPSETIVTASETGKYAVLFLQILTLIFLIFSIRLESFGFHFYGVYSMAVDVLRPGSSSQEYSLMDMVSLLPQTREGNESGAGIWVIVSIFYFGVIIVPIMQQLVLFIIWTLPMTLRKQKIFLFVAELLSAWQIMDVFFLGVTLTVINISKFVTAYTHGMEMCTVLQIYLDTYGVDMLGWIKPEDASCLNVEPYLVFPGAVCFAASALLANVTSQIILNCARVAIVDREYEIKGRITSALNYDAADANKMIKIGWIEKLLQCRCARMLNTLYALGCVRLQRANKGKEDLERPGGQEPVSMVKNPLAVASQSCVKSGLLPVSDPQSSTALAPNQSSKTCSRSPLVGGRSSTNGDDRMKKKSSSRLHRRSTRAIAAAKVLYDFEASTRTEISVMEGETVRVTHKGGDGWWTVYKMLDSSARGLVPASYLAVISKPPPAQVKVIATV